MTNPFQFDPTKPVSSGADFGHPFAGVHQARFMGAIDIGLQPNSSALYGEKPPAKKIILLYELLDDTVEVDGVVTNRRFTTTVTAKMTENSNIRKHILALDPNNQAGGDLMKLIGTPVSLILEATTRPDGSQGIKFGGVAAVPPQQAAAFPPATLEPIFFTPLAPDPEQWKKLPKFAREKVCSALDFASTPAAQQGYKADIPQQQQQQAPAPQQAPQAAPAQPVPQQVSFGGQAPVAQQAVPQPQVAQVQQAPQAPTVPESDPLPPPQQPAAPAPQQAPAPQAQGGMTPPPPPPPPGS